MLLLVPKNYLLLYMPGKGLIWMGLKMSLVLLRCWASDSPHERVLFYFVWYKFSHLGPTCLRGLAKILYLHFVKFHSHGLDFSRFYHYCDTRLGFVLSSRRSRLCLQHGQRKKDHRTRTEVLSAQLLSLRHMRCLCFNPWKSVHSEFHEYFKFYLLKKLKFPLLVSLVFHRLVMYSWVMKTVLILIHFIVAHYLMASVSGS